MRRRRFAYAVPLAGILLFAIGCQSTQEAGSGSPPGTQASSAGQSASSAQSASSGQPASSGQSPTAAASGPSATSGSTPNDSVGTVQTTFRGTDPEGSDRVSCQKIDTRLMITPYNGRIRWTAYAGGATKTTYPFITGIVSSVIFDPPSGVLDPGQSQVLHITGSFTGSNGNNFYVSVAAPNSAGSGASTIEFFCQ